MDALLLGGTLALLVRSEYREWVLAWGTPVFLAAVTITLAEAFRHKDFTWGSSPYLTTIGMTILSLGMTGLVAASFRVGSVALIVCRDQRAAILRAIQLWSVCLPLQCGPTGHCEVSLRRADCRRWQRYLGLRTVVIAISIVIAVASYHLFEKHFLRLKRYSPSKKQIVTEEMG